eukprot:1005096-Amphidinium_carterae.1
MVKQSLRLLSLLLCQPAANKDDCHRITDDCLRQPIEYRLIVSAPQLCSTSVLLLQESYGNISPHTHTQNWARSAVDTYCSKCA